MDTFIAQGNEEIKRLCAKNNCDWLSFHTISQTGSSLWILTSIYQQRNLSETSFMHGKLIALANICATELHLAMLKYPSNWVIWNFFILGGLLRHKLSQTLNWFHYQRFECCRDQRDCHMCKRCLEMSGKPFRWTKTTTGFLVVFSLFFMKTEPYLIFWINWFSYFLAKYTSHCPFFDYRYGSKGSNDVKNKERYLL